VVKKNTCRFPLVVMDPSDVSNDCHGSTDAAANERKLTGIGNTADAVGLHF